MPITVRPYIPQYITVHTGPASQWAENVTVTFPDYIKNVASSEIYPTWNEQAIRANVLAQISFALNRVYTEYYPSRGYDFDITGSTTTDQKFIKGRNTFENVDRIVDDLFTTYIRRQGFVEPLAAQFCNGTTVTCDGLSQWGSEALAREGRNYVEILRYYYGNNIELVPNTPIRDVPESYPGTPLRRGDTGPDVLVLQVMLERIRQNYPAIPKIEPRDGVFGEQTENAVKKFQSVFDLASDGVVGRGTWYKLVFLYVGVNKLSELVSQGQTFYNVQYGPTTPVLQEGSRGNQVSALQYFLSMAAQFQYDIPAPAIDGIFGPRTREAVVAYQQQAGLTPDGVVGQTTWKRLYEDYLGIVRTTLSYANLPTRPEELTSAFNKGQFPGVQLSYGNQD